MQATKEFFLKQITETVSKAVGLPVDNIRVTPGKVELTIQVNGAAADSVFWRAVMEHTDDK